jgi:hypothetical protein
MRPAKKMFSLAGGDTFPHFPASALVPAGVAKWNPRSWSANLGPSLYSCIMFEPPYLTDIQALRLYVFGQTYCRLCRYKVNGLATKQHRHKSPTLLLSLAGRLRSADSKRTSPPPPRRVHYQGASRSPGRRAG